MIVEVEGAPCSSCGASAQDCHEVAVFGARCCDGCEHPDVPGRRPPMSSEVSEHGVYLVRLEKQP